MSSIQHKLRLGFYAYAALLLLFAALAYSDLRYLQWRVENGVTVYDFIDTVIEGRRHEKNLFLFASVDELDAALRENSRATALLQQHPQAFQHLRSPREVAGLIAQLQQYHDSLAGYRPLINQAPQRQVPIQDQILKLGHRLEETAQALQTRERQALHRALERSLWGLLAAVLLIAALLALSARLAWHRVLAPLQWMQSRLTAFVHGDRRRLASISRDAELQVMDRALGTAMEELDRSERQRRQAEKLASLGTLVSGVAHELNNPLANISSACQILSEEVQQDSAMDPMPWLEQIDQQTERAKDIVHSLLSFSRQAPTRVQSWPLAGLIDEALRLMGGRLQRQRVELSVAPGLEARVEPHRLQQVIVNLLTNALDAGGGDTRIGLNAELVEVGQWTPPPGLVHGRRPCPPDSRDTLLILEVWDEGPGIPAEQMPRVFEPFFTTKGDGQGHGLGLFVSQEIIDQLGGCIGVAPRPGGGSRFLMALPQSPDEGEAA